MDEYERKRFEDYCARMEAENAALKQQIAKLDAQLMSFMDTGNYAGMVAEEMKEENGRLREEAKAEADTWLRLMQAIATLSDAAGLDPGDWTLATDDVLLEQFDPWDALREVTAVIENLKLSNAAHKASFDKIGRYLNPIRQIRESGEPLRPDWREVYELVRLLRMGVNIAAPYADQDTAAAHWLNDVKANFQRGIFADAFGEHDATNSTAVNP